VNIFTSLKYRKRGHTMVLDFNTMEEAELEHFKGGKKSLKAQMFFDGNNRILHGTLVAGATIGLHTHDTNSEIIFILSGKGTVIEDGQPQEVTAGMCHYCEKGHSHTLINAENATEDLVFYAVVAEQ
jgi:mannose-6-phosphate isomerase-like protein (cupin superfamily)